MQAMQYEITLPADYEMEIVRRRVKEKGHLLDAFPGLGLKAFLIRERGTAGSPVNQYAPFYLWRTAEGMNSFLWGPGFRALSADFGRPTVNSWLGAAFRRGPEFGTAPTTAVRRIEPLPLGADPAEAIERAAERLPSTGHSTALAVDPARWELLTFSLGGEELAAEGDRFQVLHLSAPELSELTQGRHW
ncbi:DUF4865 family protein [Kitasatospora azatica]|uniref:DUF4865 family protein n=1 Tax=Kitasatospora azatica TaxID=58347 RepID=UPI00055FEFD0|nr:DUF4865 family protein [Kitasatospora azatica]